MNVGLFKSIPIAGVYLLVVIFMLGSCEAGYFIGQRIRIKSDKNASTSLGPMVGGLLGMLAFVLAINVFHGGFFSRPQKASCSK